MFNKFSYRDYCILIPIPERVYCQEVCRLWPTVTKAEVNNGLENHFSGTLFSHTDILDERMLLFELLKKLRSGRTLLQQQ